MTWRVLGCKGWGSAIVEAALTVANVPYEREEIAADPDRLREALLPYNVLAQVPTCVMPGGEVMTESLAIVLHLDEVVPAAALLPPPGDPARREALRWLTFLVAAVYPTFTYGDLPKKWSCGDELRRSTDAHREALWKYLDGVARGPWFLGERQSAIDLYLGVMTRWRLRRAWFDAQCPKLAAIAHAIDRDPRLAAVWAANF